MFVHPVTGKFGQGPSMRIRNIRIQDLGWIIIAGLTGSSGCGGSGWSGFDVWALQNRTDCDLQFDFNVTADQGVSVMSSHTSFSGRR
jgi:hypothetical protein